MRLKRLVLQGYKTFASKTEFVFDEGITAIVGPNGSGKSNIADAVRWVLGEQSYSTLRGKRTADMIFAGSQSRPRAGMAQAILTLDNSDGWLPIDYTEVEIGRRAYRSGENEYILNGQKVRLKDIAELLATSGLAERTYTIIGQGLVDQALSLRAEERRALFEEAAGINHYKARRAETLRRLQETQRNLQRVHDILAEIRPRLTSLKRQATRAQNYEQLTADLHNLLRIWYGYRWEQAKKEMRQARETAVAAEAEWQASRQKMRVRQENADDLRRRIHRLQQQSTEAQNQRDDLRDRLETVHREVAILHERQEANRQRLTEIENELPLLQTQRSQAEAELDAATAELAAAQSNLHQQQETLQRFNANFQAQQAEINRWQTKRREAAEQQRAAQTRLAQAEGQLNQLQERLQEQQSKPNSAEETELGQAQQQIERLTAVFQKAQSHSQQLRRERNDLQTQRQVFIQELKQMRREARQQEEQLARRQKETARLEARVDMLDQWRHKEAEIGADVNSLGSLASLITIPAEHRTALEEALAARLATLILPDEASLWRALDSQQVKETALSAVALDRVQPQPFFDQPNDSAVLGWANQLVTYEAEAEPVVQLLLGRILLVQDEQTAYQMAQGLPAGALAVAPNGFVAHAGGLVERNGRHTQDSILAREEAWRSARAELETRRQELDQMETAVARAQADIQTKQSQVDALQQEEQQQSQRIQEADQNVVQAQRDLDREKQQQRFLAQQQQAQAEELARLTSRIEAVQTRMEEDRAEIAATETAVSQAAAELEALPVAEAQQQRENLRKSIDAAQTIVDGRRAVVDSRRATLNQVDHHINRLQERLDALQKQQAELALNAKEQERQKLQAQLEELDARLGPIKTRLNEAREELAAHEEETAVLQKETHDHETIYTQAKVAFSQQQNQIEGLQERIKADLGLVALHYDEDQTGPTPLPISGIEELPTVTELPEDIEETIGNYRGQMQRMGAINPDAPEEYRETQDRYDFLTDQIDDLNQTEAQLRDVIEELDDLTSRAFAQTVAKVNKVFGETFTQLFGGGAGRLVLTDPDDLTISGVDIIARLPNRREQGLGLLSGGERSLTAAALIFSLLKVSPTPFCIMDEVDAALDEANINRFREQLRDLSLNTQFIVITHNRGTVQAAQTIYGISMGGDSASQAISIRPEDYVKQVDLL